MPMTDIPTLLSYYESTDEPTRENISRLDGKQVAARTVFTPFSTRWQFYKDVLGYTYLDVDGETLIKVLPATYPWQPGMFAASIDSTPLTPTVFLPGNPQIANYNDSKVVIIYETPDYDTSIDEPGQVTYAEQELEFGGEWLTLPRGGYYWATTLNYVNEPPAKLFPHINVRLTQHFAKLINKTKILNCVGKVNDATFYGFAAKKLLFLGATTRRAFTSDGFTAYTVTYNFSYRPEEWNKFLNPATTTYDYILSTADLSKVYEEHSFSNLDIGTAGSF